MEKKVQIFLAHAREDKDEVMEVYRRLEAEGFKPWIDKEDLLAGQDWDREIRGAIKQSDLALVFFSKQSVSKRGYYQRELTLLLKVLEEMPPGQIFVIPIRLDECEIHEKFEKYHHADLFESDGFDKIVRSIREHSGEAEVDADSPGNFSGGAFMASTQAVNKVRKNADALVSDALEIVYAAQEWAKKPRVMGGRFSSETIGNVTFERIGYPSSDGIYRNANGVFTITTLSDCVKRMTIPSGKIPIIHVNAINEKTGNRVCIGVAGTSPDDIDTVIDYGHNS